MADDEASDPDGDWVDSEALPASQMAGYLFEELDAAESPEEHRAICGRLIRGARHLSAHQIQALAEAVEAGFERGSNGRPRSDKRRQYIRDLLVTSGIFPERRAWERKDFVREIMRSYRPIIPPSRPPTAKAIGEALDKVVRELEDEGVHFHWRQKRSITISESQN